MELISLKIRNFKGLRSFEFEPKGKNCTIYGDNGTFKTTLFDAFVWVLFGKDSMGQSQFEIKNLDSSGNPDHGLSHEVEVVLSNSNGQSTTLLKTYKESWVKKRGSAEKVLTGHTIDHFLNGVPTKAGEYTAAISKMADEQLFKLLTNPRYFNEQLHWQKRREVLLNVCGEVSDADVIASDPALAELPGILGSHTLENYRKIITGRRTEVNREIEAIPVRISECQKGMVEIPNGDPKHNASKLILLRTELTAKQQEQARIESGGEIAEKTKILREIEGKLINLDNQEAKALTKAQSDRDTALSGLRARITGIEEQIAKGDGAIARKTTQIADLSGRIEVLRAQWVEVDSPEYSSPDTCPTCGQTIPEDQRQAAVEHFNAGKAAQLEEITVKGRSAKQELLEAERTKRLVETDLETLRSQVDDLNKELMALQSFPMPSVEPNPERTALLEAKIAIEKAIQRLKESNTADIDILADIQGIEAEIRAQEALIAQIDQNAKADIRIKELKAQERKLASEYERIEKELYLCDLFIRAKVGMLTSKINGKFPTVRFKLFETQINGGITEVCETLVNGIPYSSINSAAKIQSGMEICEVMSQHHGVSMPCVVDNRESVIELPKVSYQVISLVVSAQDKQLRVERS